jgi:hypothetical protein
METYYILILITPLIPSNSSYIMNV